MNETLLLGLLFALLVAVEWRYRLDSVRLLTAVMALGIWFFAQPSPTRAARRALDTPPAERITQIAGQPLSEYAVGVRTMEQAAGEDAEMFVDERWMSVGVLFWLACSPVFRRRRSPGFGQAPERELEGELASRKGQPSSGDQASRLPARAAELPVATVRREC